MSMIKKVLNMRKTRFMTAVAVMFAVVFTTADVHAAVSLLYTPYAGLEYEYTENVTCGTIRYVSQNPSSVQYKAAYWGNYSASSECLTANISMALSYVGANVTPQNILDYNRSTIWKRNWGGITSYAETTLDVAMANYINGAGKYSPPILHLTGDNCGYSRGHYVLVVGKVAENQYEVIDPYCDVYNQPTWQITIADDVVNYALSSGSRICSSPLSSAYQYYNANAVIGQQAAPTASETPDDEANEQEAESQEPATIADANFPQRIIEGQAFSIKGIINSQSNITNVTVAITNSAGAEVIAASAQPGTTSYDIYKGLDNSVAFGTLVAGKYVYTVRAANAAGEVTLISQEFVVAPAVTSIISANNCASGIYLKWKSINSATGYYIFRREGSGEYTLLADVAGNSAASSISFTDKKTKGATRYAYRICAYKDDAGTHIDGDSSAGKACFKLSAPGAVKVKRLSSKSIRVSFKKVKRARYYQVQYSTSKNFSGAKIVNISGNTKTIKKLKKGKKYYVRVRACMKSSSITYRSAWSAAKRM